MRSWKLDYAIVYNKSHLAAFNRNKEKDMFDVLRL